VLLAEHLGLLVLSASCSLLGDAAQKLWHAVRHEVTGKVRAVYAELDDGMVHKMPFQKWKSSSGAPWPYKDEFEVGCTLEHAGYYLGWLVAMFGPAKSVTVFSDCLVLDKLAGEQLEPPFTPDFSVGVLKFANGVVARLSTTIIGPHNHSIQIIGDDGVIGLNDCWFNDDKVYVRKLWHIRRKSFLSPFTTRYKVSGLSNRKLKNTGGSRMDFAAGVMEMSASMNEQRQCLLSPRFSLHVNEIALALQGDNGVYEMNSTFDAISPLI